MGGPAISPVYFLVGPVPAVHCLIISCCSSHSLLHLFFWVSFSLIFDKCSSPAQINIFLAFIGSVSTTDEIFSDSAYNDLRKVSKWIWIFGRSSWIRYSYGDLMYEINIATRSLTTDRVPRPKLVNCRADYNIAGSWPQTLQSSPS